MAFWATPVGQLFGAARSLATEKGLDIVEAARLLGIAGLATGDAMIAAFNDKYNWMFWRPVTAIHEAATDGNDATEADPAWVPLIDSLKPPNTPPYPDHPSGWNSYAGAIIGAMQEYFGTDDMAVKVGSPNVDEPRSYASFTELLQDGIEVRILEGLHFRNADEQAAALGQKAAALAADRLAPVGIAPPTGFRPRSMNRGPSPLAGRASFLGPAAWGGGYPDPRRSPDRIGVVDVERMPP